MNIAFFGSSLVSSYRNGAATYYRGLLRALARRGHRVVFCEPDALDRQAHRDINDPDWAQVVVYPDERGAALRAVESARGADLVVKTGGVGTHDQLLDEAVLELQGPTTRVAFWDADAPATLERVRGDRDDPFRALIPRYDIVFTYGGGPPVIQSYETLGAARCVPIHNALDPDTHRPVPPRAALSGDLGFLGNRLPDRELRVHEFFVRAAKNLPHHQFILGGSGWDEAQMPGNVRCIGHVASGDHNAFNASSRAVLHITRDSMAATGYSPPTRVFEAAGAGACLITNRWKGLAQFLEPGLEGERVRGKDLYGQMGGGKTQCTELVKMADMKEIEDGKVDVVGPDVGDMEEGGTLPLGIYVQIAGREFQADFEPILERQIHHLINYIQGIMHIGQRDISWIRISKAAVEKGFTLKDIGKVLHAKMHQDFGKVLDKVQVTLYTKKEDVDKLTERARAEYKMRDERVENMRDEDVDTYYSCTLCQSFAPNHVCSVSPERTGLCGAYNWMDCKASFEINPTGPNQPIKKGETIDPRLGQWKGVNEFVKQASRGAVEGYNFYSIVHDPMTTCGCCECIAAVLPTCNGIMTVNREFTGDTPCGMKFTTLAGVMGGGAKSPGFVGHSKFNITQRKFIRGDGPPDMETGGILRIVWMPKALKEEVKERIDQRGEELGYPNLYDMIADETVGTTEDEVMEFLKEKGHPALEMESIVG